MFTVNELVPAAEEVGESMAPTLRMRLLVDLSVRQ